MYSADVAEFARMQDALVRETIARTASTSPFYRERLAVHGVDAQGIRTVADLMRLPLTSRKDLQENTPDFWAVPPDRVAELIATTGTTGEPIYLPMTIGDLDRLAEGERRGFSWLGAQPGERYHIAITLDNLFIAGLAYHMGLQRAGVSAYRVGAQPLRRHLDIMKALRPDGIVAVPSLLLALARQAERDGDSLIGFAPRRAMLIGDAIRGQDLTSNTLGRLLEAAWGGTVYSTYGLTEAGLAFHECPLHRGLHAHPDLIVVEIVDDEGRVVPDGQAGELVITTLQVEGAPLLRYQTGDVTFLVPGDCPCGRRGTRLGPILGRKQHRLKVKGTTLYPKAIEDGLLGVDGVENFVIEAHTGDAATDRLVVRVGATRQDAGFERAVSEAIYVRARVTPEVHLASPADIERRLYEGGRRKPRVFIDFRNIPGGVR